MQSAENMSYIDSNIADRQLLKHAVLELASRNKQQTMPSISSDRAALCAGCGGKISDRYYLLAVDKQWHMRCLKCCECKLNLESELTCFSKDGSIYCKEDYYRRFSVQRCARCHLGISASEMVMRARDLVYHLNCFTCTTCNKMLTTGDHFGMKDNLVYCRLHFETLIQGEYQVHFNHSDVAAGKGPALGAGSANTLGLPYYNGVGTVQKGRPRKRKSPGPGADLAAYNAALSCNENDGDHLDRDQQYPSNQKTKRMRTSFKLAALCERWDRVASEGFSKLDCSANHETEQGQVGLVPVPAAVCSFSCCTQGNREQYWLWGKRFTGLFLLLP
uniref:LIM homeobox 2 n=1 Tax=Ficedula albicollis TaxID=59894 RepID=A0A803V9M0_FICAL